MFSYYVLKDGYWHSENGQKMGPLQGPVAPDTSIFKTCLSIFLLRVKFATKLAFIEVMNPSTQLYKNV